jgi:hypothetical protein
MEPPVVDESPFCFAHQQRAIAPTEQFGRALEILGGVSHPREVRCVPYLGGVDAR